MRLPLIAVQLLLVVVLAVLVGGRAAPGPIVVIAAEHARVELTQTARGDIQLRGPFGTRTRCGDGARLVVTVRGGGTLEVGTLSRSGTVELAAHRITVVGTVTAERVRLSAEEMLHIDTQAELHARDVELDGRVVMNVGKVAADGSSGGRVLVSGDHVMNQGALAARGAGGDGGSVSIAFGTHYVESRRGSIDVSGGDNGGAIRVHGSEASHLFTSGSLHAGGRRGGAIALVASDMKVVGASLEASGIEGGGDIALGAPSTRRVAVRGGELAADSGEVGPGGRIVLASLEATAFGGHASARGGRLAGDGGFVDVSSAGQVAFAGAVETDAPRGRAGRLLIDPKNITIGDATVQLLSVELADPTPFVDDEFGSKVASLPTGNIVVADWLDDFAAANAGAVHLFSGDGALIATVTGSTANDFVGFGAAGLTLLSNGNYVVGSVNWDNGGMVDAGAVAWADGTTGIAGALSPANSLVGTTASALVGIGGVTALSNGNYVVRSENWDNGGVADAGAVTWGNGTTGIAGAVSAANSLVGATASDRVGNGSVVALSNGNYVVPSSTWDNGGVVNAGAVTWGNGTTGIAGAVSVANSLVGTTASASVGSGGVTALSNGNYVVRSQSWDSGGVLNAGAVTWANGTTGIAGAVTAANSLVGTTASDLVGNGSVTALSNGNYVVASASWDNGGVVDAGAVTWGNGTTGIAGAVSAANSLVGTTASAFVGIGGVTALSNGNYVVRSNNWDNGAVADAGAVTWGNGATGIAGAISAANSLVGTTASDQVGNLGLTALSNGNYVVRSTIWNNGGVADAGAVTWGNGTTGIVGAVSVANSLVGTSASDSVGSGGLTALSNGNYVVRSQNWDSGGVVNAGAVTRGNGTTGIAGAVSAANSLVGTTASDLVGGDGVTALSNGNYVVRSTFWNNGGVADAGAVTWGNGTTGIVGAVSAANSLVGTFASDRVGVGGVTALSNGNYVVVSPAWENGGVADAGAVTWGNGTTGIVGAVSVANSLVGTTASDQVGGGVTALSNGNYVVVTPTWDDGLEVDAGAVTDGGTALDPNSAGVTGVISASNSLIGPVGGSGSGSFALEGPSPGTIVGSFTSASPDRVVLWVVDLDGFQPGYAFAADSSVTIAKNMITVPLSRGIDVTLEASNDLVVGVELLVDNPTGDGGNLTLAAGRRVTLNATVATDGGDFTLIANDLLASGVVDGHRDPGTGGIVWDPINAVVDAGAGAVSLHVRDGEGKTHSTSGALEVGHLTAGSVLAQVDGATLVLRGNVTASDTGDAIVLVTDSFFLADVAFAPALAAPNGRFLVYSPSPAATAPGPLVFDFEEHDKAFPQMPDVLNTGDGILYASSPPDTSPIVTVEQGAAQIDPSSDAAITFDVEFDQDVTGFVDSDIDLGLSTAGANLMAQLAGGPATYTLTVTGMDTAGVVIARVPAAVCDGVDGTLPNAASVSVDNVVTWTPAGGAGGEGGSGGASEGGAGPGGSGPGGEGGAAEGGEGPGGAGPDGGTPPDEEGCSCSTPGNGSGGASVLAAAMLLVLARFRRVATKPRRSSHVRGSIAA